MVCFIRSFANQWLPAQNPIGSNSWTSELGIFLRILIQVKELIT